MENTLWGQKVLENHGTFWKGLESSGRGQRIHSSQEWAHWGQRYCCYLNCVLQLGILIVEDTEAEWLLWDHFDKHEIATLERERE